MDLQPTHEWDFSFGEGEEDLMHQIKELENNQHLLEAKDHRQKLQERVRKLKSAIKAYKVGRRARKRSAQAKACPRHCGSKQGEDSLSSLTSRATDMVKFPQMWLHVALLGNKDLAFHELGYL